MTKSAPFPSQLKYRYGVRMSDGLKDRIEAEAKRQEISFNDVILACLLDRFPDPDPPALDLSTIIADLQDATSPDDFAARAREANRQLEAAGLHYRVDMVPPFPGKIAFSVAPKVPVPAEGETVVLGGKTIKRRGGA